MKLSTPVVISCNEHRREVSVIQNIANKQIDRTFAFDKVFGPTSQQKDLYDQSVFPIVNEVLESYNCTIFAYGQTGTGKTYTMEGGGKKTKGKDFRTWCQLGNNAFCGANYIQSISPHLSLGSEIFWLGHQRKFGIGFAARYNTDKMVADHELSNGCSDHLNRNARTFYNPILAALMVNS